MNKLYFLSAAILFLFSCSENNTNSDSENSEIKNDTLIQDNTIKKEDKIISLSDFFKEKYPNENVSVNDINFEQTVYTENKQFITEATINDNSTFLLLIDNKMNVLDFKEFVNQSGDDYAEELDIEIYANEKVTVSFKSYNILEGNNETIEKYEKLYSVYNNKFEEENYNEQVVYTESKIKKIRYYFAEINEGIQSGNYKKSDYSDTEHEIDYEYFQENLFFAKLTETAIFDLSKKVTDYYLLGGKIFFAYEQMFAINELGQEEKMNENRFYFDKGEIIRLLEGIEKVSTPDADLGMMQNEINTRMRKVEKLIISRF